jgi:hypothetical protein
LKGIGGRPAPHTGRGPAILETKRGEQINKGERIAVRA